MKIELKDEHKNNPHRHHTPRVDPNRAKWWRDECAAQLEQGRIEESDSQWCNRIVFHDKEGKTTRVCMDLKSLNKKIKNKSYTLPRIADILDSLHGAKYFSLFDLTKAYAQCPLEEGSRDYTAFQGPGNTVTQSRRAAMWLCIFRIHATIRA